MTLKKLIIAHSFPENNDDFRGKFIIDYIKLSSDKSQFYVLAPNAAMSGCENKWGAEIHYFKWTHGYFAAKKIYNPFHFLTFCLFVFINIYYAMRILKKEKIDSIFACWAVPAGLVALILKLLTKTPYSVWLLGTDVNKFINIPFLLSSILNNADTIYANSTFLAEKVKRKTKRKIELLPTYSQLPLAEVPRKIVKIDNSKIIVTFVGRLEYIKGIDVFIEVAKKVTSISEDFQFLVIGDGSLRKNVELEEKNNVILYAGKLKPSEIAYYAEKTDVLLITSRQESMPVVFWEFRNYAKIISLAVGDVPMYLDSRFIAKDVDEFVKILFENFKKVNF